ncbi:MAG: DEAD/DEAH box helicase [Kiritimatiellae bacterium]|nr:DEAD/DEAH box helicase [Kiritimatiellia bacterium]
MPLLEKVMYEFDQGIRNRGKEYYRRGVVQIQDCDKRSLFAEVQGVRTYGVCLGFLGNEIHVSCTCPYYEDKGLCKHIWATFLTADNKGVLPGMNRCGDVRVKREKDEYVLNESSSLPAKSKKDSLLKGVSMSGGRKWRSLRSEPVPPSWLDMINTVRSKFDAYGMAGGENAVRERELTYILNAGMTLTANGLVLEIVQRERRKNGDWGMEKPFKVRHNNSLFLSDPRDQEITSILAGGEELYSYNHYGSNSSTFSIPDVLQGTLIPMLCATKRCFIIGFNGERLGPLSLGDGLPWVFRLVVSRDSDAYVVKGMLCRNDEQRDLSESALLLEGGKVFWANCVDEFVDDGVFPWIILFRDKKELRVPAGQGEQFLESILGCANVPDLILPQDLAYEEVRLIPRPFLKIRRPEGGSGRNYLNARLDFEYGDHVVSGLRNDAGIFSQSPRRLILRDKQVENAALAKLFQFKVKGAQDAMLSDFPLEFHEKHFSVIVRTLIADSWRVEADGKLFRQSGGLDISVTSGIDWFELRGECGFGEIDVGLPELLKAMKRGENTVILGDGTFGVIPEDWLKKYGSFLDLGSLEDDHLRFSRCQVGVLDALLAAQPDDAAKCDAVFDRFRDELRSFKAVTPADPPSGFKGNLRDYQKDGMGWLLFLNRFGFGGCLADDMGLGKTVQALSLIESRRQLRAKTKKPKERLGPSLVVVPRSLLFNWREEAEKFTPKLRVLVNTGMRRVKEDKELQAYDLILTTYTTLRLDVLHLKDVSFDYVILDESQAIKNAKTATAKAVRLLQCRHRLALSGTPIENHLGELWSLFEFLNPGMLGTAKVFKDLSAGGRDVPKSNRDLLSRAVRPFILRRTKAQVAPELPKKLEETLYCELDRTERKAYNELRDYYRKSILSRVEKDGLGKSKIHVLEALLRLRQAACHPGLIDKSKVDKSSTKLDTLLSQVGEVVEEGHKALVFSQFTSMLGIVRPRLDSLGIQYAYLDGRTRKREEQVREFQENPDCMLFLISLKAGGLGLNLTAAEYVYLLDPWWNPAVEAQAIDRTHRIGQLRPVFAYRLIARNTVEEKVIELQQKKRELADAVLNADSSLIRDLSREDLELLLA